MDHKAYTQLASLHAQLCSQLQAVIEERDQLKRQLEGEEFSSGNGRFFKRARKEMTSSSKQVHSSDFIWHTFYFNDRVLAMLEELFTAMDTQNKGEITIDDFKRESWLQWASSLGEWDKVRAFFDTDGSNSIDPSEFSSGFARWALNRVINLSDTETVTYAQAIQSLEEQINSFVAENIAAVASTVKNHLADREMSSSSSWVSTRQATSEVASMRFNSKVVRMMGNLFDHLDQDKRNEITLEGFVKAQRTSDIIHRLGTWEQIRSFFDKDGSNTIDSKEFVEGFKNWLLQQTISFPARSVTLSEIIQLIDMSANNTIDHLLQAFAAQIS